MMQNTLYEYSPLQLSTLATPLILVITIFLILLWKSAAFVFSQSNVPGPKGNWLTGQLFALMQSKDVVQTLHEWSKTYGPIVRYRPKGIFGKQNSI